jgi:carbon dioxide concentrating mechanism protein CcmO
MSLGILEIASWSAAMAATDAAAKAAPVRVIQAELNDMLGGVVKLEGDTAAVGAALAAGRAMAEMMHARCVSDLIPAPDAEASRAIVSPAEYNPLIEQDVVHFANQEENPVSEQAPYAIGMIETQGFTAVIEAIDAACKAASVEVIGKEKLGGGYITVLIKGDVAAVRAAIDAGQAKVEGLGKLIASHVIPRPSTAVLGLLPKGH